MKKGVIVPLIATLGVMLAAFLYIIISILTNVDKVNTTIDDEKIEPSLAIIKTNSFLKYTPEGRSDSVYNIISSYRSTGDSEYRNAIETAVRSYFKDEPVELRFAGGDIVWNGIALTNNPEPVLRNITLSSGAKEEFRLVFYS